MPYTDFVPACRHRSISPMKGILSRPISRACIIALPAALLLTCTGGEKLVRLTRAVERSDVEMTVGGSALIRSVFCDLMVEPVDGALWEKLANTDAYMKKPARGARRRVPMVAAFHVIIKSTIGAPLRLENARLASGDTYRERMTGEVIAVRLKSPAYSAYDFGSLLSYRRLIVDKDSSRWIDYDRDTLASTFDFIPPYDTVVTVLCFERMPREYERLRLTLDLSASGNRKSVSCDFVSHDYRAGDPEYRKILKDTVPIDDE